MATRPDALGEAARIDVADLVDLQFSPLGLAAMDALAPLPGQIILDLGCGAGQTLPQLAQRVGPTGRVIGVDIAPGLLAVAAARIANLPNIDLIEADAARLALPDHSVDGAYSRFGVMMFADPPAAFRNFRRIMRPGARIAFVCWRSIEENELDQVPLRAAGLDLTADATPYCFARQADVMAILGSAGFEDIAATALDLAVSSGGVEEMLKVVTNVGALGKQLRENPALRADAEPRVRAALAAIAEGETVSLAAAVWIVTATAP